MIIKESDINGLIVPDYKNIKLPKTTEQEIYDQLYKWITGSLEDKLTILN